MTKQGIVEMKNKPGTTLAVTTPQSTAIAASTSSPLAARKFASLNAEADRIAQAKDERPIAKQFRLVSTAHGTQALLQIGNMRVQWDGDDIAVDVTGK